MEMVVAARLCGAVIGPEHGDRAQWLQRDELFLRQLVFIALKRE